MGGKKYDKHKMWTEFLESDQQEVIPWLVMCGYSVEGQRIGGALEVVVNGWADKKRKIMERSLVQFEKKFQDQLANDWGKVMKNASRAEMKILNDFSLQVHNGKVPKGTKELERVFKMFRLALGKSTNNNQNTNANLNIPLSVQEEKDIADAINKNNAFYNRPRVYATENPAHEDQAL